MLAWKETVPRKNAGATHTRPACASRWQSCELPPHTNLGREGEEGACMRWVWGGCTVRRRWDAAERLLRPACALPCSGGVSFKPPLDHRGPTAPRSCCGAWWPRAGAGRNGAGRGRGWALGLCTRVGSESVLPTRDRFGCVAGEIRAWWGQMLRPWGCLAERVRSWLVPGPRFQTLSPSP